MQDKGVDMNFLATAAIIAITSSGLMPQDQAQTPPQRFSNARAELERHFASTQYKEVIKLLEGIIPSEVPEVKKDPQDPGVLVNSLIELGLYQDMHSYMGRALVMNGNIERSLDSFQKAKDIAELKTKDTEDLVNTQVQMWTQAIEHAKKRLADIETLMKTKEDLEAKRRRTSEERKQLDAIKENMLGLEYEASVCKENISKGPIAIAQMNDALEKEKENAAMFAPVIAGLEETLKSENEMISANFGGDKAKYVASVVDTKENLEVLTSRDDKIKFLNRLLFLDSNNKTVQQQLALLVGN
jgi:tetratricopeptide (TPR) repeat protein